MANKKRPDDRPEPLSNVGFLCEQHSRKPDPKFLELPVEWFIGKFCQLGVPMSNGKNENMWFKVLGLAEHPSEELKGELNNDPLFVDMACGDLVEFSRKEILQVTE